MAELRVDEGQPVIRSRWTTGASVLGACLFLAFLALGFGEVRTSDAPCGSGFAPGWAESVGIDTACTEALAARRQFMTFTGVPALALLALAAVGRILAKRNRPAPQVN